MSDAWVCAGREEQAAHALEELVGAIRLPLIRAGTDPHTAMLFILSAFDNRGTTIGIRDATIARLQAEISELRAEIRNLKCPPVVSDVGSMADMEIDMGVLDER